MAIFVRLFAAFFWGFAEASWFFIVPDVLLSRYALNDLKFACRATLYALLGAAMGGYFMFEFSRSGILNLEDALVQIPAITPAIIQNAKSDLNNYGLWGLFIGAFSGRPYKVYAVLSGNQNIPILNFLMMSIFARLSRFLVVTLGFGLLSRRIKDSITKLISFYSFWIIFYVIYFALNR